jgi:hypothetical protein
MNISLSMIFYSGILLYTLPPPSQGGGVGYMGIIYLVFWPPSQGGGQNSPSNKQDQFQDQK